MAQDYGGSPQVMIRVPVAAAAATAQVIVAGTASNMSATATQFQFVHGGGDQAWGATFNVREATVPSAGVIDDFHAEIQAAPGSGNRYRFTLFLNGSATAVACDITHPDLGCTDTTGDTSFSVSANDEIALQVDPNSVPATRRSRWAFDFTPTTADDYWILGDAGQTGTTETERFFGLMGAQSTVETVQTQRQQPVCEAGVIGPLHVRMSTAVINTTTVTYEIEKDTGSGFASFSPAISCVIDSDATAPGDIECSDADTGMVNAGDLLSITQVATGTLLNNAVNWSLGWDPTTAGRFMMMGSNDDALNTSGTTEEKIILVTADGQMNPAASTIAMSTTRSMTVHNIYTVINTAPGSGNSWVFKLRSVGATTFDPNCAIENTATACNDTDSLTVSDDDDLSFQTDPNNSAPDANSGTGWCVSASK
ncbi:MAG: hypothetical protein V3R16_02455 [Nitrospirales bacterium]